MDASPAPAADDRPKTLWERILAITPVVMTVISTLLAGLSSSEMTQAQYHRSLAAQRQSKAGDQWAYFQAKRTRGLVLETAESAHWPPASGVSPKELDTALQRLVSARGRLLRDGKALGDALNNASPREEVEALRRGVAGKDEDFQDQVKKLHGALEQPRIALALDFLQHHRLPEAKDEPVNDPAVAQALALLHQPGQDDDLDRLLLKVSESPLQGALDTVQGNLDRFDAAARPFKRPAEDLENQVDGIAAVAVRELDLLPPLEEGAPAKEWEAASRSAGAVRQAADGLRRSIQSALRGFEVRRYRREADYNQQLGDLYELEVRKSGLAADRHRTRSKNFFYAMLCAQAAVTIASLSLAVRQHSLLWVLASVAGVVAVAFSGYVYLFL